MTFTDADHDKAVELYERYKGAEWWPKTVHRRFHDGLDAEHWHDGSEFDGWCHPHHALSAIAWAMVERFGSITLVHRENRGWMVYLYGDWQPTRFLALAASMESLS